MSSNFEDLHDFMAARRRRVEETMLRLLPNSTSAAPRLADAMTYAAMGGGKRIRPILVYAACELAGGTAEMADVAAAAIELLHTYSLVHDDLPAMDDDDLRRGRATCHRAYDEATAILAGDTLHTLAFEMLSSAGNYSASQRVDLIRTLCYAAGADGMAAGQMQDMQAQGQLQTLAALEEMHYLKTGRLITASLQLGLIASGREDASLASALTEYGDAIGLAFQVQDDILDVTGSADVLGKSSGSDEKLGKSTFPGLIGLDPSRQRAKQLCDQACAAIAGQAPEHSVLIALARYIIERQH
ncbi:polyprenyl synthetase family protein [Alcanivorax sp. 1008]|uniref:polyprenyl synthetase family protein n=1 Tax=Alcanivorax sp. 1008 TaxID=2816853 RepID=UPI001D618FD0|nr:farnesyl diphosphate synthase [Alcanivorax sp. 1008]MCC1497018.1 polyprenyl synthetase family protein [Alcanivorax sp. 1008]